MKHMKKDMDSKRTAQKLSLHFIHTSGYQKKLGFVNIIPKPYELLNDKVNSHEFMTFKLYH